MMNRTQSRSFYTSRAVAIALLGAALPVMLAAQSPALKLNVLYACPATQRLKVYSCAGTDASAACDVQVFTGIQPGQRGPAPRGQVMAMLQLCHLQTPAEAQADARGGANPQSGSNQASSANGIKVGDEIEVVTGFGWTPAKVLAINGNSYRVLTNGIQVTKDYPSEVRRLGAASAQDHANGQYRLGDRVQVNVQGSWTDGKVVTELNNEYQVELPGNRTIWASGPNLRPGAPAPAPSAPKAGVPPKPGTVSCAGKIEGRYATTGGGFGSFTVTFRSGKATFTDVGGNDELFECWTGGEKVYLRQPGNPNLDMDLDINNDGTLQTPIGEIKKKGN